VGEQRSSFEPRLESLRGLAALNVATHHGIVTFAIVANDRPFLLSFIYDWLLERLSNPGMSVLFFFVLSGHVLGRSLERNANYLQFIVRRTFRIVPAFVVSVLFGYACLTLFRLAAEPADLSTYFLQWFYPIPSLRDLWDNFLFRAERVNGPTWSVYWEIIGSIFLPLLVILHLRAQQRSQMRLFIFASAFISFVHVRATSVVMLPIVEYFYAGFFLPPLVARYLPDRWIARVITFAIGYWLILTVGPADASKFRTIAPASLGGALMIGAVISEQNFLGWLEHPSIRFLGRISYSFYLFHWPVFYLTALAAISAGFTHGALGNWIICSASIVVAVAVSAASYRLIELPSIEIGRRLAHSLSSSDGATWRSRARWRPKGRGSGGIEKATMGPSTPAAPMLPDELLRSPPPQSRPF